LSFATTDDLFINVDGEMGLGEMLGHLVVFIHRKVASKTKLLVACYVFR
jgi:glycopeptide antibiotics resistance protein